MMSRGIGNQQILTLHIKLLQLNFAGLSLFYLGVDDKEINFSCHLMAVPHYHVHATTY